MKLSIIVVSFNTKDLTLSCLDSIKKEGSSLEKETIVVDNNSKDGSVEALRKLKSKKEIILIKNKKNTGFAKANNQAIDIAKGEHILLLNSDTVIKRGVFEKLVNFAEKKKNAGLVAPKLLNKNGTDQPSVFHFPSLSNAFREYWGNGKGLFEKYTPEDKRAVTVDCVVAACVLITRTCLEKVGKLDERYFFYFEDIDYCRRVKKAGLKTYYLPQVKVIHVHGASGEKLARDKDQWRRLIPSSKIYHGVARHYLLTIIIWLGQKWKAVLGKNE